ncbi:hypothetical protein KPH14_011722 [Odynerus spinipes]|uniref:Uncharacterized protein n=1 Tax=Odynerus spinipes TaxID=1348599 RepID=A0AAD9RVG6_9HYME|nr:hypothetical protein KPH14_011722 [Odynerus spinipes]
MEADDRKMNEWLQFQRELLQEKDLLTNWLSQINKQIHALQVEQLHLLSSMNTKNNTTNNRASTSQTISVPSTSGSELLQPKHLDLSVPTLMEFDEEEENSNNESDE